MRGYYFYIYKKILHNLEELSLQKTRDVWNTSLDDTLKPYNTSTIPK